MANTFLKMYPVTGNITPTLPSVNKGHVLNLIMNKKPKTSEKKKNDRVMRQAEALRANLKRRRNQMLARRSAASSDLNKNTDA